jgi:hypothetical protein
VTSARWLLALISLAGLILAGAGCASPDAESELPWNMSQPWESAPSIPFGGAGGGY